MQGGLEIPCKMVITMDIRTKRQQEVLDRYKELVNNFYFEPPDGEDIVGSFVVRGFTVSMCYKETMVLEMGVGGGGGGQLSWGEIFSLI